MMQPYLLYSLVLFFVSKVGIIFLCIIIGMLLRRFRVMSSDGANTLNRFVIYVSLPALVLHYIHGLEIGGENAAMQQPLYYPALMAWIVFFGAVGVFSLLGKWFGWSRQSVGALILTAGLGNTAFVGFALVEALYGAEAMPIAILVDQLGSFLVLSTMGILTAFYYSGRNPSWQLMLKKIIFFPPFVALIVAVLLRPFPMPDYVDEWLLRLGGTLVPLALTGVGMQLSVSWSILRRNGRMLVAGLGYKLALAPLVVYGLYSALMPPEDLTFRVIVLEAAMAPMISAGILASEYELRSELAALMVGIGIPLSLLSVPLVEMLLR
jgi:predicted permease